MSPERHTNADLMCASAHGISHQSVQSDSGQEERERRERAKQDSVQSRPGQRGGDVL